MKKIIYIAICIFLMQACSSDNTRTLAFFNGLALQLEAGEKVVDIHKHVDIEKKYVSNFDSTRIAIPLFKYVKHTDYDLYVGLPFNHSITDLIENQKTHTKGNVLEQETDNSTYLFSRYQKDNLHVTEYIVKKPTGLVYLLGYGNSAAVSSNQLSWKAIEHRIIADN